MRITQVEIFPLSPSIRQFERMLPRGRTHGRNVFLKLHTDDGLVGLGDVYCSVPFQYETWQSVTAVLRDIYGPVLIGQDPFDIGAIMMKFDEYLPENNAARTAVDHALFDLIGKKLDTPIYKLLGGRCWERIPLEWSVGLNPVNRMVEESLNCIDEYGVNYICIKVGPSQRWKEDVEAFAKIREAVGDRVHLAIDANGTYTQSIAIGAIREMEEHDLAYVEQPVPRWDLDGMAKIRQSVSTPIMADEGVFTIHDAVEAIKRSAVDIICVKLPKPGGLHNAKKIAAIAEGANVWINNGGGGQTGFGAAACIHFYTSTTNMCPAAEFLMGLALLQDDGDLLTEETKLIVEDGYAEIPDRPGLGVELDEAALEKYATGHYVVEAEE